MAELKETINKYNEFLKGKSAAEVIEFAIGEFGEKLVFATSLGAEDQVIAEMLSRINPEVKIFTLDTGRLFPETYDLLDITEKRYKIKIDVYFPDASRVENMVNEKGINLFYESIENRKLCCHIRKIEPLTRALSKADAWISGLRREQSVTRQDGELFEWDLNNKKIKINPLIEWSNEDVWEYIKHKNIPYNKLHDKGYPSIGCLPCTRPVAPGEDIRSGRWWWEEPEMKECGLHKR
jgi:phosphoadenosine phosphosulfate reductase